jgi:hypothetical protein
MAEVLDQVERFNRHMVLVGREVKAIFAGPPERFAKALLRRWFAGTLLRWLFLGPDGRVHRAGEIVLAELRDRNLGRNSIFDPNPQITAYREGRRAAIMEIFNFLNLDEGDVLKLVRLDDGDD